MNSFALELKDEIGAIKKTSRVYLDSADKAELLFEDQLIVQFKAGVTKEEIDTFNKNQNLQVINIDPYFNQYVLRIPDNSNTSLMNIVKEYIDKIPVEIVMPDLLVEVNLNSNPNDSYFGNQYYLNRTNVPSAWDITIGSSNIIVAVIDDGGEVHPDLPSSRIWVNSDETDGDNDDDDGNGYFDDINGWDFFHNNKNPFYNDPTELDSDAAAGRNSYHGIACAGIIAATRNNSTGIAGIAPNSKIMFLRIMGEKGDIIYSNVSWLTGAINYARQNGADIISNSWGVKVGPNWGSGYYYVYEQVRDACIAAMTNGRDPDGSSGPLPPKGCIIVACLGNNGLSDNKIECPANVPGVISVGALDEYNNKYDYSPLGVSGNPDISPDVMAPSGDTSTEYPCIYWGDGCSERCKYGPNGNIWTLDRPGLPGRVPGTYNNCIGWAQYVYSVIPSNNDYTPNFAGTSAACPQVSGLAALILSITPGLTDDQIRTIINSTAVDLGSTGFDVEYGYGRINTYAALKYTLENYGGTLTQTLTIPAGETWTFQPGVTVNFASGTYLNVYGALNASGTSSSRITFTSSSGTWGGIRFYSNGTSGHLSNCNITNVSTYGVYISSASPYVGMCNINCNINGTSYGVYITGSTSWPQITQNYIYAGTACVYHTSSGNGYFTNNKFLEANYGVNVISGSPRYDYYNVGRNKFDTSIDFDEVRVAGGQPYC